MSSVSRPKTSLRRLVSEGGVVATPLAHDALTARMIEWAGFSAIGVGGSSLLAARYALPDIGLAALGEMAAGIADILAATSLPVLVDGDDGYGGVRSVARLVEVFARIGVSGIVLEDQVRDAKQPGDAGATAVADVSEMAAKLRTAVATCAGTEIQIIARCDAYQLEGLDGALRRAERYLGAGAHGLFVPGLKRPDELAKLGERFRGVHLVTAAFEGRETWLPLAEYQAMGFRQVVFPALLITRVVQCIESGLAQLKRHVAGEESMPPPSNPDHIHRVFQDAVQFGKWLAVN